MTSFVPLGQRRVFVDSGAYLALFDADDEHHDEAVAILADLERNRFRHFTTNVVLIECHALILSTLGRAWASRFLQSIATGATVVVRVRAGDEEQAKVILFQYTDKDFSFADAISFVVMERLGIRQAFTFDRHFSQYGFAVLRSAS
jgi:predicted nucleic acid-binding protein